MQHADALEAEGHDFIAKGHARLAEAQRLRAVGGKNDVGSEWVDPVASPLGKRRTLALCRAGALESSKVGKKILVLKASLDAFLARHKRSAEPDGENLFG